MTPEYKSNALSSSGESPIILIEIHHSSLPTPWRITNYPDNITHQGYIYHTRYCDISLPTQGEDKSPELRLVIGNIDRDITEWIDSQRGARGSRVRVIQVLDYDHDVAQIDYYLDIYTTTITDDYITIIAGMIRLQDLPVVRKLYDQYHAPGIL